MEESQASCCFRVFPGCVFPVCPLVTADQPPNGLMAQKKTPEMAEQLGRKETMLSPAALSLSRARQTNLSKLMAFSAVFLPPLPSARSPSSRATAPSSWSLVPCSLCSVPQAPSTRAARQSFQDANSYQRTDFCYSYGIACVS